MNPILFKIIDDKSFIDYLQSGLVPLIAIITTFIAYRQWKIEKIKLTHNLFERRFIIPQEVKTTISKI